MFQLLKTNGRSPSHDFRELGGLSALFSRLIPSLGRRTSAGGALELLGALPLTTQSSLALIRLHDETLLLGITAQSVTLLTRHRETEVDQTLLPRSSESSLVKDPLLTEQSI